MTVRKCLKTETHVQKPCAKKHPVKQSQKKKKEELADKETVYLLLTARTENLACILKSGEGN